MQSVATDRIPEPEAAAELFKFRRDDLALLAEDYLRESRSAGLWRICGALGGFALGPILITLGGWLGWPDRLAPVFFFGGWAIFLGCVALMFRRARRLRLKYQFPCPVCDQPLLDGIRDMGGLARIQMIGATGACPHCGAQICES
jgi:hypothetical protein